MCDRSRASSAMMPLNGKVHGIDPCIHHIVAALNAGGVWTRASCCGHGGQPDDHGSIVLDDGRVLVVLESEADYDARFGSHVAPTTDEHVHQIDNRCTCGSYYVDGRWMPAGEERTATATDRQVAIQMEYAEVHQ